MSETKTERRKHQRFDRSVEVEYRVGSGPIFRSRLLNLSLGGAFIAEVTPPPAGTPVTLRIQRLGGEELCFPCEVARSAFVEEPGMGVRFSRLGEKELRWLSAN